MASLKSLIRIHNGRIITPEGIIPNGSLLIRDGRIVEVANYESEYPGSRQS